MFLGVSMETAFPLCFFSPFLVSFSFFPFVTLSCSLSSRAGVQVSYVHRSAPGTAFICTRLGGGDRFRPLPERLEHNISMAGTFSCTSETCTWGADHRKPLHSDPSSRRHPPANNHPWTSTHAEDSRPPRNTNGTYTQKRPEDHRTRHRRICASPARQRR